MDQQPLTSEKATPLHGTINVPGDKSISHRALMFGALAIGKTTVTGLLEGEDVLATAAAMREFGANIKHAHDGTWEIYGVGIGGLKQPDKPIDMGNSGTSTRLLIGLVATHPIEVSFTGDASLSKRPMNRVIKPLEQMNATFSASENGRLPLTVHGSKKPIPIEYRSPVASAQLKSAVILAALNTPGTTTLIEETPTRDHTENMLNTFGVDITTITQDDGALAISITGLQELTPCHIDVPGDPSSAAFPTVGAILNKGSDITIKNVGMNDRRNGIFITLQEMGADIRFKNERNCGGEPVADIIVRGSSLKGINVPVARVPSMIDEFPILAVAAACANGTTTMRGLGELRVKESDRLLIMAEGLKSCGVNLEMGEDSLTIHGTGIPPVGNTLIQTELDHRIAMSFLVLGTVTDNPIHIDDGAPITTSFPNFIELMNDLGTSITLQKVNA